MANFGTRNCKRFGDSIYIPNDAYSESSPFKRRLGYFLVYSIYAHLTFELQKSQTNKYIYPLNTYKIFSKSFFSDRRVKTF